MEVSFAGKIQYIYIICAHGGFNGKITWKHGRFSTGKSMLIPASHELLQDDLLVGIPEAGRSGDLSVLQNVMGFFVFLGKGLCHSAVLSYITGMTHVIEYDWICCDVIFGGLCTHLTY
jgi:hypothetical protein